MVLYVLAGAIGLPVFANFASGITSPSSCYLFGFIAAVYGINKFKDRFGLKLSQSFQIVSSIALFYLQYV